LDDVRRDKNLGLQHRVGYGKSAASPTISAWNCAAAASANSGS
jgi:hypothetical protein